MIISIEKFTNVNTEISFLNRYISNICFVFLGFVMTVEAVDSGNPQLSSQATVIVNLLDENDNPPIFKRRKYQGFMNSDLSDFRNDLQVISKKI